MTTGSIHKGKEYIAKPYHHTVGCDLPAMYASASHYKRNAEQIHCSFSLPFFFALKGKYQEKDLF
jgi:hypothetical protein